FGALAGARRVTIGDSSGSVFSRARVSILCAEAPRLALELLIGYGLLLPLSWLITEALRASLALRGAVRASRLPRSSGREQNVLYIRATLSSAGEGGMKTHVAGFASGAAALGHRLSFLVSGVPREDNEAITLAPSKLFSANRTLFELWNNLVFTSQSLQLFASATASREFDCIYQRYSRFNWTGVALSLVTGLPLSLEYNGSEVWIGRRWDPIGQLTLLKRFEKLNLRAADLIFVVSEVERRNLTDAGVQRERIIVNPNGVDTDRFRPQCGGAEIRRQLGLEDKTVIGFVGTFGPWHGAPILAE